MKVAILDIGSNTTKILVAQKDELGLLTEVAQKSLPCRFPLQPLNPLLRLFQSYLFSPKNFLLF
jgi:hypothetical protein